MSAVTVAAETAVLALAGNAGAYGLGRALLRLGPGGRQLLLLGLVACDDGACVGADLAGNSPRGAGFVIAAAVVWCFARWWRKNRDRVKALLGAKSRALRDALVRKAREAWQPRPVLAPGGVR